MVLAINLSGWLLPAAIAYVVNRRYRRIGFNPVRPNASP